MTTKIKMGLSDTDMANAEFVTKELDLEHKADAVAFALAFARSMIEEANKKDTKIIVRNEDTGFEGRVKFR